MRLVQIDSDTFIKAEEVRGLQGIGPNLTYIFLTGDTKIEVRTSLYNVKTTIENALKEDVSEILDKLKAEMEEE